MGFFRIGFLKFKWSSCRLLPMILLWDQIDYEIISLISQYISEQGKIVSRYLNRLTSKQQWFIAFAIRYKQDGIVSLTPSLDEKKLLIEVQMYTTLSWVNDIAQKKMYDASINTFSF